MKCGVIDMTVSFSSTYKSPMAINAEEHKKQLEMQGNQLTIIFYHANAMAIDIYGKLTLCLSLELSFCSLTNHVMGVRLGFHEMYCVHNSIIWDCILHII